MPVSPKRVRADLGRAWMAGTLDVEGPAIVARYTDVVDGLAIAVTEQGASAVIVGRHRSRWVELVRGSVARRLRRRLPDVVVETVEHD